MQVCGHRGPNDRQQLPRGRSVPRRCLQYDLPFNAGVGRRRALSATFDEIEQTLASRSLSEVPITASGKIMRRLVKNFDDATR